MLSPAANGDGGAQPKPSSVEPFVQSPGEPKNAAVLMASNLLRNSVKTLEDVALPRAQNASAGSHCSAQHSFTLCAELAEVMRKWTRLRGPSVHTRAASPVPTGQAPGKRAAPAGSATPRVTGEGCSGDTSVRRGAMTPRYTGPYPTVEELDMESRRLQDAMRALQREAHTLDVRLSQVPLFLVPKSISRCRAPLFPNSRHHHSVLRQAQRMPAQHASAEGNTGKRQLGSSVVRGTTGTGSAAAPVHGAAAGAVPDAGAAAAPKGSAESPAAGACQPCVKTSSCCLAGRYAAGPDSS